MKLKKFAALLMTLAMLVSAFSLTAFAADPISFELKLSKDSVYVGDVFTVDLYVTLPSTVTTLRQAQVDFTFNGDAMKLVKTADTTADAAKAEQAVTVTDAMSADYLLVYGQSKSATSVSYSAGYDYTIQSDGVFEGLATGKIYSFTFKALAEGSMNIVPTAFTWQYGTGTTDKYTLADSSATNTTSNTLKVSVMPVAPTITIGSPAFTGEAVEEGTVTPSYTWDNGNQGADDDKTTGDISIVSWYAGADKLDETTAKEAFTVPKAAVGKELSYTVLPKADRTLVAEGTLSAKTVVGTVKAISTYAPSVTAVALDNGAENDGEILASTAVTAEPTFDNTYGDVADYSATTYEWYAVKADDATAAKTAAETYTADSETIVKLTATGDTATFDANLYKDWYAVVKVTPSVTITGDTARPGVEAAWGIALVTGEPPTWEGEAGEKLATKKLYTNGTVRVAEKDAKATSNATEISGDDSITYNYEWYYTGADYVIGEKAGEGASFKIGKEDSYIGKYLVLIVTATDSLNISSSLKIDFKNAIAKASSSGSGTQGGASLVTGTQGPSTETPGTETPGTETPGEDDNLLSPENPTGDPTDGKETGAAQFKDVDASVYAWGYNYLDALAKAGIVKGMDETTFAPEADTTYAQYIALVVRALGLTAEEAATTKVAAEHWSYAEVAVADALGLLADFETINADAPITREDMAVIAYKGAVAAELELADGEAIEFTDAASISEYAAEAVEALTKAGIINGMGDDTFAPKGTATRMQTAKVIGMLYALIG